MNAPNPASSMHRLMPPAAPHPQQGQQQPPPGSGRRYDHFHAGQIPDDDDGHSQFDAGPSHQYHQQAPLDEEAPRRLADVAMYDYFWPIMLWLFGLFTMVTLFGSFFVKNYDWGGHAALTVISVLGMGGMAVVHKWVLRGPDGVPNRR